MIVLICHFLSWFVFSDFLYTNEIVCFDIGFYEKQPLLQTLSFINFLKHPFNNLVTKRDIGNSFI